MASMKRRPPTTLFPELSGGDGRARTPSAVGKMTSNVLTARSHHARLWPRTVHCGCRDLHTRMGDLGQFEEPVDDLAFEHAFKYPQTITGVMNHRRDVAADRGTWPGHPRDRDRRHRAVCPRGFAPGNRSPSILVMVVLGGVPRTPPSRPADDEGKRR